MFFATIKSGSSGNCIIVGSEKTAVLVDAGCSLKAIKEGLAFINIPTEMIKALFISHEHTDHISGAYKICQYFHIPLFASEKTWDVLPFRWECFSTDRHVFSYDMTVGDLAVDFFRLSHDAIQPVGFVFKNRGKKIGIATDTGMVTPSMYRYLKNVDGLVLEANHDPDMLKRGPYPYHLKQRVFSEYGHLSNFQAADLLNHIAGEHTKEVLLSHLSATNNYPDLALETVSREIRSSPFADRIHIHVAPRSKPHPLLIV